MENHPAPRSKLGEDVRSFTERAEGLVAIQIFEPSEYERALRAALQGNLAAQQLIAVAADASDHVTKSAEAGARRMCLCCPKEIDPDPLSFGICISAAAKDMAAPEDRDGSSGKPLLAPDARIIINFLCLACLADTPTLFGRVTAELTEVWPDIREMKLTHSDGGRA